MIKFGLNWKKMHLRFVVICFFFVSLAVKKQQPLCQGYCNGAFCQEIPPPDEITIVPPPSGDPQADPQEY